MKLAIVTACPNGKVSSVLSARLLEAAALRQGWETSVEIIDPNKSDQQLSAQDIEAADLVLVVNTGPVDLSRFVGKRLFQDSPAHALQDVDGFLQRAEREAQVHAASEAVTPQAAG
ncbi:FruA, partial [Pseudomonas amygdali pv. tabaci str. ATCC 11528]|uniref:PTS fructose transporter subunit IIB n=1 Tax=Pseudomonas amygdali TaxID=47877 RepID=UPI0001BC918D